MAMATMQEIHPFVDSAELLADAQALRDRAHQDGYLLLRGLLPEAEVLGMRALVLEHCRASQWLDESAPLMSARRCPGRDAVIECVHPEWRRFYRLLYTRRELHAFNQHPRMLAAGAALFGGEVLAHARPIVRVMFPGSERFTTPPHQDCYYIGGTLDTWTAWIPLGDCPEELGGLAVAAGSHLRGPQPVHSAEGAGGHAVAADDDLRWTSGPMRAGDVLLFHSCTIHQARDNRTADQLRLSCDFRYQAAAEAVRADSLEPHVGIASWDEIYAGWASDDPLRRYWQRQQLNIQGG